MKTVNMFNSLNCLSWVLKIFSLNLNVDIAINTKILIVKTILTAVVLATLTIFCICRNFLTGYNFVSNSIKLTEVIQMIYNICQYNIDLIYVNIYGRFKSIEYFKQYNSIDKILSFNSELCLGRKTFILVVFFTLSWLLSSFSDFVTWVLYLGWVAGILYAVNYIYLYIKMLTIMDMICQAMNIEIHLKTIGDFIQYYYSNLESHPGMTESSICSKTWFNKHTSLQENPNKPLKLISCKTQNVKWLTRCYLMLTEQVEFINSMYGIRVSFLIVSII